MIQRGEYKLQNQKDADIPSLALTEYEYVTEGKLLSDTETQFLHL